MEAEEYQQFQAARQHLMSMREDKQSKTEKDIEQQHTISITELPHRLSICGEALACGRTEATRPACESRSSSSSADWKLVLVLSCGQKSRALLRHMVLCIY
jgi:hypothetical protein